MTSEQIDRAKKLAREEINELADSKEQADQMVRGMLILEDYLREL